MRLFGEIESERARARSKTLFSRGPEGSAYFVLRDKELAVRGKGLGAEALLLALGCRGISSVTIVLSCKKLCIICKYIFIY